MEYRFTLRYRLSDTDKELDDLLEGLGAAGCDDALVGIGLPNRIALDFVRQADSAESAITSALADVKQAIPTAELIEASPDIVGLSDAADVVGVSRQNLRKLMIKHSKDFPLPIHTGSLALWHLEDLVSWLQATMDYQVPLETLEIARFAKQVNLAKQARQLKPGFQRELRELVA